MALFFLVVFLGGAIVVGALVKLSAPTRPRYDRETGEEYDVWGRSRQREPRKARDPEVMGAARLS